jgi:hypothetical protein
MSGPYIGLYTILSLMGAEGITIGVLFGTGMIVLKAANSFRKKEEKKIVLESQAPRVDSFTNDLI